MSESSDDLPTALQRLTVQRWQHSQPQGLGTDEVITEVPVALVFNGISQVVMMATPTHLPAMGLGFALSEGLVPDISHVMDTEVIRHVRGLEVHLKISSRCFEALKGRRRQMEGRSGCGLCGIDSLQALDDWATGAPGIRTEAPLPLHQTVAMAQQALQQLPARQGLNQASGGCHAAGWADDQGQLQLVHEDVGRHNALDKLIGELAQRGWLQRPGVVVMSSRASVELVRKCARVGLPALATISAPSSLAVDVAQQQGLTLLCFCRGESASVYAAPGHIGTATPLTQPAA